MYIYIYILCIYIYIYIMYIYIYIYILCIYICVCECAIQPVVTLDVPPTCQTFVHASDMARSTTDHASTMTRGSRPHRCEKRGRCCGQPKSRSVTQERPRGSVGAHFGVFLSFGVDPKTLNLVWNRIPLPLWTLTQGATLVAEPGGPTEPVESLGRRHVSDS